MPRSSSFPPSLLYCLLLALFGKQIDGLVQDTPSSLSYRVPPTRGKLSQLSPNKKQQEIPSNHRRGWVVLQSQKTSTDLEDIQTENGQTGKKKKESIRQRRSWDENYVRLLNYFKEHGHPNVPRHHKEDPKLGQWVERQRRKRHSLSPEKCAKLEALNITWDGVQQEKYDQRWEDKFQCLQKYKEMEGDCRVPIFHPKLGHWVNNQRTKYKGGKLAPYRIEQLESIGFEWRLRQSVDRDLEHFEEQWKQKFEELLEYQKKVGHCQVPQSYQENPSLGRWVNTQRERHADGHLREDRKELLEEIGFTWNFEELYDEAWNNMYNQLVLLKNKQQEAGDGRQRWANQNEQPELYGWEVGQQNTYKRGTLDPKREAKLADIGYWNSLGLKKVVSDTTQDDA